MTDRQPRFSEIAVVLRRCLQEGRTVEIDGLGAFLPDTAGGFRFVSKSQPKVFVAYVQEDAATVERFCDALETAGFDAWLDRRKLLPGQNWPRSIEEAIETTDFFVPCFSSRSVGKKGGFQAEIRYALDCARRMPLDEIFLLPVRLNDCRVPARVQREWQYVDLFPDWDRGLARLTGVMRRQIRARKRRSAKPAGTPGRGALRQPLAAAPNRVGRLPTRG